MKYLFLVYIFAQLSTAYAYNVTFETDVNSDDPCEIEEQIARAEDEAKSINPHYGIFRFASYEITEDKKINVVLSFAENHPRPRRNPLIGDMPGIQFAPFLSGTIYDSGVGYKAKSLDDPKPSIHNFSQSGRFQVFFDMGRALRMKMKGRILITAGYYSNLFSLTEVNNQRKVTVLPMKQFGEINLGVRINLGWKSKKPLENHFTD